MKSRGILKRRTEQSLNPKDSPRYVEGRAAFFMHEDEDKNPYGIGEIRSRMEWLAGWYDAKVETQGFDDVKSKLRR